MCTDGGGGSNDDGMTSDRIIPVRVEEQSEAARVLGVKHVIMLGHPDGQQLAAPSAIPVIRPQRFLVV